MSGWSDPPSTVSVALPVPGSSEKRRRRREVLVGEVRGRNDSVSGLAWGDWVNIDDSATVPQGAACDSEMEPWAGPAGVEGDPVVGNHHRRTAEGEGQETPPAFDTAARVVPSVPCSAGAVRMASIPEEARMQLGVEGYMLRTDEDAISVPRGGLRRIHYSTVVSSGGVSLR